MAKIDTNRGHLSINHHQKPMEGKTMRIGVPKERLANETRVAATPKTVEQLLKLGLASRLKAAQANWPVSTTRPLSRLARKS
jgi:NAD(P) transhydrogenase subunit alpha